MNMSDQRRQPQVQPPPKKKQKISPAASSYDNSLTGMMASNHQIPYSSSFTKPWIFKTWDDKLICKAVAVTIGQSVAMKPSGSRFFQRVHQHFGFLYRKDDELICKAVAATIGQSVVMKPSGSRFFRRVHEHFGFQYRNDIGSLLGRSLYMNEHLPTVNEITDRFNKHIIPTLHKFEKYYKEVKLRYKKSSGGTSIPETEIIELAILKFQNVEREDFGLERWAPILYGLNQFNPLTLVDDIPRDSMGGDDDVHDDESTEYDDTGDDIHENYADVDDEKPRSSQQRPEVETLAQASHRIADSFERIAAVMDSKAYCKCLEGLIRMYRERGMTAAADAIEEELVSFRESESKRMKGARQATEAKEAAKETRTTGQPVQPAMKSRQAAEAKKGARETRKTGNLRVPVEEVPAIVVAASSNRTDEARTMNDDCDKVSPSEQEGVKVTQIQGLEHYLPGINTQFSNLNTEVAKITTRFEQFEAKLEKYMDKVNGGATNGHKPDSSPKKNKRSRTSALHPTLPSHRLSGDKSAHICVITKKQNACRYCSYLRAVAKLEGTPDEDLPTVARPARMCHYCQDYLCNSHFDLYHS